MERRNNKSTTGGTFMKKILYLIPVIALILNNRR